MTSNQSQSIDYRKAALQQAVIILEQFTNRCLPSKHSKSIELIVQDNRLVAISQDFRKKVMNGLLLIFSRKARRKWLQRKQAVQKTVLNAIDTVKSHHLLLTKLHTGSTEDQQLARNTLETIQRYNKALQQRKKITLTATMSQFFYKYDRSLEESPYPIELPSISWLSSRSLEDQETPESCSTAIPALSQEVDLIRLKASTLLRQHGVQLSTAETVKSLQAAPIQAILNSSSKTSTLCLTLQVLPGTTIKVRGSFKRENATASAPIPNSFKLSVNSTCSGFPTPSQYAGWSLGDHLIPSYPHHLDQLPLFAVLYHRKKEIIPALLPNGSLVNQAQQVYTLKQKAFEQNSSSFLKLHEQLAVAIHRAGAAPIDSVAPLFHYLKTQEHPFSLLEQIYQTLDKHYIVLPNAKLEQTWLTKTDSRQENSKGLQQTFRKQLEEQYLKPINLAALPEEAHAFVLSMGEILGPAAATILLQLWSEMFKCPPPMLNCFEQKLQAAVLARLRIFQEELSWSMENSNLFNADFFKNHMESYLKQDITLFRAASFGALQTPETALVDELEDYFNSRYFTN